MLRSANSISNSVQKSQRLSRSLQKLIVQFWRFSQFYGDYHALPPSERRRFVIDQQKPQNQSR